MSGNTPLFDLGDLASRIDPTIQAIPYMLGLVGCVLGAFVLIGAILLLVARKMAYKRLYAQPADDTHTVRQCEIVCVDFTQSEQEWFDVGDSADFEVYVDLSVLVSGIVTEIPIGVLMCDAHLHPHVGTQAHTHVGTQAHLHVGTGATQPDQTPFPMAENSKISKSIPGNGGDLLLRVLSDAEINVEICARQDDIEKLWVLCDIGVDEPTETLLRIDHLEDEIAWLNDQREV